MRLAQLNSVEAEDMSQIFYWVVGEIRITPPSHGRITGATPVRIHHLDAVVVQLAEAVRSERIKCGFESHQRY